MAAIEMWLRQPGAQAVGWALLQFVWQGAVVGMLTAAALLALRRSAADVRYVVASIGLALMLTLPMVTGVQRYQVLRSGIASAGTSTFFDGVLVAADGSRFTFDRLTVEAPVPAAPRSSASRPFIEWSAIMRALLILWIAGVTVLTLRLLTGWIWVQRLRTHGVSEANETCRQMTARLARRLHIARAITLLESTLVDVPTVIGFLMPVVLLPASALAGLTPQQTEAILAHELAHIRRHDYLVNLLQTLVETVLFYHPAVWWLSHRIRIERENCCDDLAVSLCGDPVAYAAALADLEALRSPDLASARHIAMAATGGSLIHRVRRLLGAPSSHSGRGPAWLAGTVALLLIGGISAGGVVLGADARREPVTPVVAVASQSQSISTSQDSRDSRGNWSWSNNGDRLDVSYAGRFELTDDDTDIRQLSVDGWLKISDGKWLGRHSVEIREHDGQLVHLYYVNGSTRAYEPEGRLWLQQNLPRFVRNTGIGAESRVARILKRGGPSAVMAEISRVESAYVQGVYYKQLFRQATLTAEQYRQAMAQAGRQMRSSSYELAQLLISVADNLPNDDASRAAYFDAASGVSSDYEVHRVYSAMLKRGPVSSATLTGILTHAGSIDSDFELAELLRQILSQQTLDERNRTAFFTAVSTIGGAYERHRVLSAVISSTKPTDPAILESALSASATLHSDYETSTFLQEVLRQNGVEGSVRAPFFAAANTLGSSYERGRVLEAVVRKSGTSTDTLRAVLQSSRTMNGYELSQLLQLVARTSMVTGELRDAYLDAADRLGGYEQGQVMTALVKSERRK